MKNEPGPPKNPLQKRVWVKPELKRIPVDDEEGLLEYCRGKPYNVQQLKEVIKTKLPPDTGLNKKE